MMKKALRQTKERGEEISPSQRATKRFPISHDMHKIVVTKRIRERTPYRSKELDRIPKIILVRDFLFADPLVSLKP